MKNWRQEQMTVPGLHDKMFWVEESAHTATGLTRGGTACRRTLLAREQARMRGEYEERLRELERERVTAEADKAQARSAR